MEKMAPIQTHEILAWLGDDHGLTQDQIAELTTTANDIAERRPDQDDVDERAAALTVAYRIMTGDTAVLDELARELTAARTAQNLALAGLQQAAITLIRENRDETQAGFARRAGVDRMTVRDWLGLR